MEKTGQLLQKLRGWDFSGDGGKQRSIAIMFAGNDWDTGYHPGKEQDPEMLVWSLWDPKKLSKVITNGVPTNIVLWAINSEFPSSLGMMTHLTFTPDCVPVAAAKRIVQIMPNLKSCTFGTCFRLEVGEGWTDYTDKPPQTFSLYVVLAAHIYQISSINYGPPRLLSANSD